MLRHTVGMMRELPRLHEITSVFIRHGLGDFVQRIGIAGVLERAGQILHWGAVAESVTLEPAQRMRMALEELGPDLRQARPGDGDARRPVSAALDRRVREAAQPRCRRCRSRSCCPSSTRALGRSPFEVFRDIDTRAQGAASIAQVHRAKLQDGTPVVLKVRRPGRARRRSTPTCACCGASSELIESEMPGGAALPAGRDRGAVRALARARARLRHRDAQHRALRQELRRRSVHRHPEDLSASGRASAAGAGAHRRHSRRPILAAVEARGPRPQAARGARRRRVPEDDPDRRLLPRRPASGQRVLPAGQPHRDHRLRHGGAALAAAAQRR